MKSKKNKLVVDKNWHSYHVPGQPNHYTLKRNVIYLNSHSTYKHEIAKSVISLMLLKHGDFKFNPQIVAALNLLDIECKAAMEDFVKEKHEFVTEACPNSQKDRRVDLVDLETDTRIEIVGTSMPPGADKEENTIIVRI